MTTLPRNSSLSRPRKKVSEWQSLINEYEQSSLTRKQFCERESLPLSTFDYWRHKLRQPEEEYGDESVFVALTSDSGATRSDALPWDIELQLGESLFLRLRHRC